MTISLDRYQELMTLPINAFNGLNMPTEPVRYACSTIWKQSERDNLLKFLYQAQDMREKELGYFLTPTYTVEEMFEKLNNPHVLRNKFLIAMGKKATADVALNEAITLGVETAPDDPVTVAVATTVTDVTEIHVYKNDTLGRVYEVNPSYKAISAGTLTLKIPRARLVNPDYLDDREDPLSYYENDYFVTTIDIIREYTDPSQAVDYQWYPCNTFTPSTQDGYAVIEDTRLSIVKAYPANWTGLVATPATTFCFRYQTKVLLSYLSGKGSDNALDMQTIRLAHTLMPYEPCTCDPVHQYWLADVERDPSNLVTPYGSSKAAIAVWIADSRSKIGYGSTVG